MEHGHTASRAVAPTREFGVADAVRVPRVEPDLLVVATLHNSSASALLQPDHADHVVRFPRCVCLWIVSRFTSRDSRFLTVVTTRPSYPQRSTVDRIFLWTHPFSAGLWCLLMGNILFFSIISALRAPSLR